VRLNIQRIIDDFGGASKVANLVGTVRTAPYGWVKRQYVSSRVLEQLKSINPALKIDKYFENEKSERSSGVAGAGMVDHSDQAGDETPTN